MFMPFLSLMFVFAMESTSMTRIGCVLGNANMFMWIASYFLSVAEFFLTGSLCDLEGGEAEGEGCGEDVATFTLFSYISIPFYAIGVAFYVWCAILLKRYFVAYRFPESAPQRSRAVANIGNACDFTYSFLVAFFIPIPGAAIVLCVNRSIQSRFGVLTGFGVCLLAFGIASIPFWFLGFLSGNPMLLMGMIIIECSIIHFKRVIIASEIK